MSNDNKKSKYASYGEVKSKDKPKSFGKTLKQLISHMREQWAKLIFVIICVLTGTAMSTVGPMLLGDVVDTIQQQVDIKLSGGTADLSPILNILLFILGIYGISSLMSYFQHYVMAGVVQEVVESFRNKINSKLSRMPLKYFDSHPRGDIMSRVVNDVDNINISLQNNITHTISSFVTFFGMLIIMFTISVRMTLVTLSVIPLSLIVAGIIAKVSQRYFRKQWKTTGELNGHIEEMYTGQEVVKAFGYEEKAVEEFDEINNELYLVSRKAQLISGIIMPILNFVNNFGYVLICIFGSIMVLKNQITIGVVISFVTYSKLFSQPLTDMANILNNIQSCLASAERVFNVLEEDEEAYEEKEEPEKNIRGFVEFENVYFSYEEDEPLIENLNLEVNPGELIAIVGHTGAGKTTIVNLLMRFYEVNSGTIKVDGKDIRSITRDNVRKIFGMVLQDTWLFNGTIKENIAYGKADATDEEIIEASKSACVHEFIESLPDGYNTIIDENGTNISQGQKQLITIARTILSDPSVLILDEATSSVDTRTEKKVQAAMGVLMNNRTSFIIAHRLSTIRDADKIIVMENGKIVESGNHEDLMKQNGVYRELYMTQYACVESR